MWFLCGTGAPSQAQFEAVADEVGDEGAFFFNAVFFLVYGVLMLSYMRLRLVHSWCYGLFGPSSAAKSMLIRQPRDSKVGNFWLQDQRHSVMVELALQGEDLPLSIIDSLAADASYFFLIGCL
jgi:hypothetical protein